MRDKRFLWDLLSSTTGKRSIGQSDAQLRRITSTSISIRTWYLYLDDNQQTCYRQDFCIQCILLLSDSSGRLSDLTSNAHDM